MAKGSEVKAPDTVLLVGFDRPIAGREKKAIDIISKTLSYFEKEQRAGRIASFEAVSLSVHGGKLNEFVLVRGSQAELDAIRASEEFEELAFQGYLHAEGMTVVSGVIGERLKARRGRTLKYL